MLSGGALLLIAAFAVLLLLGVPIAVALGLSGVIVILALDLGIASLPTNVWTGIAKYPLLALPVFIAAGMIFERSGVAERLVRLMSALIGRRAGGLALVAILVSMILGGISGSGAADAAAVATVLLPSMLKQGYPRPFIAGLVAAAGSTAILIPPSIAFIVYAVIVPGVSIPALFIGGIIPGILAGVSLMVPALWFARKHGWGARDDEERPPIGQAFREASWGLAAPIVILGGLRSGAFTPTEAGVVAVFYGLFVGVFVYRTLNLRRIYEALRDSAEISAVVLTIIAMATVFAHAGATVGAFDAMARSLMALTDNETLMLLIITTMLLIAGMLLDAISIFMIFIPILMPVVKAYGWDPTWFGIIVTMNLAIGSFTPPMAVNLMVTCRIAGCTIESTTGWVMWMVAAMGTALLAVTFLPELALFLPRLSGAL
jgi:tripartite ATP-independent transporter DctM subunit